MFNAGRGKSKMKLHRSPFTVCRLPFAVFSAVLALTASAQTEISDESLPVAKRQGPPVILGASNCIGTDAWDVVVEGADASGGGKYEIVAGNPSLGFVTVGRAPVNPRGGVTVVRISGIDTILLRIPGTPTSALTSVQLRATILTGLVRSPETPWPYYTLRNPKFLGAPSIPPQARPLYERGVATGVFGQQAGDAIILQSVARNPIFTVRSAAGPYQYVGDFSGPDAFKNQ